MTSRKRSRRWTFTVAMLGLLIGTLASCGGGGDGGSAPPPVPPSFTPSPTVPAPNLVTMTGSASGSTLELQVNITGQTTATNIYGFAFDLLLSDATLVAVNSATAGSALTPGPGGLNATAALNGSRITVGVSKLGTDPGNGIAAGTSTVVRIVLRTLKAGTSTVRFVGSTPSTSHTDAAAFDPTITKIPTITFDDASGTITQN